MSVGYFMALENTLGDVVSSLLEKIDITGVQTIIAYEDGLEPEGTYCVIDVLDVDQVGKTNKATFLKSRTEEVLETMSHYSGLVQISVIGKESPMVASALHHHLTNNQVGKDVLDRNGLGVLRKSSLRKIPQQRESRWVNSFNMDLNVSFAIYTIQTYDWVEYITVNGNSIKIYRD